MRLLAAATLCASMALTSNAGAQSRQVDGASAAGLCASAMDFVAGARAQTGVATPRELARLQRIREFLLALPQFQPGLVAGYAEAWSQRMAKNMSEAASEARRQTIAKEIAEIAVGCQRDMAAEVNALEARGIDVPNAVPSTGAAAGTVIRPAPAQPVPQPYTTQPLQTQPLIINPQ